MCIIKYNIQKIELTSTSTTIQSYNHGIRAQKSHCKKLKKIKSVDEKIIYLTTKFTVFEDAL